ncbi:methanethiol oxidase [Athalia rosae]|uniref:methanethiol oxidase n=1 Tax=Athalia rosae TaxID=37344 RepID=UPI00203427F3|nr:methanethiol oxidase [Athalia rosae]
MQTTAHCTRGSCGPPGPGYKTPREAMLKGPREGILYVICPQPDPKKPDVLATVDVDPKSPTYCQIVHRLRMPNLGDELHHTGWNICSSCYDSPRKRDTLVLPCLVSDRVYFVDVSEEREPKIKKTIEPEEMHKWGLATPHTSHCSPTGEIIISTMGKPNGDARGNFLTVDSETLESKGVWSKDDAQFGYDFWYQPHHDALVATEWATPKLFKRGFQLSDVTPEHYGSSLNFYSWNEKKLLQTVNLGKEGQAPLETRFLHDPTAAEGFVGCAINANIFRFFKNSSGQWVTEKVIDVPAKKVEGWIAPEIQGMITDILLSLDDKYLYFSNWLHGDVRQYDITDRRNPKLISQVFLGGSILSDGKIRVLEDKELDKQPDPVFVKGRRLHGSPQMLQLSLDGKRLYVSTSIFSVWDKQFYPDHVKHGSTIVKLDVDIENGGMTLDKDFLVDFGLDKDEILLAHEMRYPGGDCTSDIWLPET